MNLRFDLRAALLAIAAGMVAVPAMAEDVTLTIENMSGADLTEFYASPVGTESWGANLLGAMIVAASNGPVTIAGTQGDVGAFQGEGTRPTAPRSAIRRLHL